jgi:predicted phosphodiesterase
MTGTVAALYDIHGNLPALEAVLAALEAEPPDAVVVGGDVAAGPMPVEVLERLRAVPWPVHFLRGNADRFVVMGYDGTIPEDLLEHPLYRADAWTATFISRADRDWLAALPPLLRLELEGAGEVLFCHATPRSDEERVSAFATDERIAEVLAQDTAPLIVAGHTHRQFDRTVGGRRLVNAGSVGRPYEHAPGAYWLWLGPEPQLRCTPYDTAAATEAFRAVGYPLADSMLAPCDADAVARRYEEQGASSDPSPASLTGSACGT